MAGAAVRAVRTVSRAHGPPTTSLGHCITVKDREVEISTQGRRVMKLYTVLWDAGHRLPPQAEPPLCFFLFFPSVPLAHHLTNTLMESLGFFEAELL